MWNTLYIKGKGKFKESIRKGLNKSDLKSGEDYIEGSSHHNFILYWINPSITLKTFKLAISAKYVWKHRLEFEAKIENINKDIKNKDIPFSKSEQELVAKFRKL